MFEMLVGFPPFYSEEPLATCRKVCLWNIVSKFDIRFSMSPQDKPYISLSSDTEIRLVFM